LMFGWRRAEAKEALPWCGPMGKDSGAAVV